MWTLYTGISPGLEHQQQQHRWNPGPGTAEGNPAFFSCSQQITKYRGKYSNFKLNLTRLRIFLQNHRSRKWLHALHCAVKVSGTTSQQLRMTQHIKVNIPSYKVIGLTLTLLCTFLQWCVKWYGEQGSKDPNPANPAIGSQSPWLAQGQELFNKSAGHSPENFLADSFKQAQVSLFPWEADFSSLP